MRPFLLDTLIQQLLIVVERIFSWRHADDLLHEFIELMSFHIQRGHSLLILLIVAVVIVHIT